MKIHNPTLVFNFFGGPGSSKSTSATYCFAETKDCGINAEYVPEKAKDWAWEKRNITLIDQFKLFIKQTKREKRPMGEASVLFCDSPVWLSAYYSTLQSDREAQVVIERFCHEYYKERADENVLYYNIWLGRVKPYNPKGRFQTEEEAHAIDHLMLDYLPKVGVNLIHCPGIKESAWVLVSKLLSRHPEIFGGNQ